MRWLLLAVLVLTGCTFIWVGGDGNEIQIEDQKAPIIGPTKQKRQDK